jgi:uncharacterized protein
MAVFVDTSAFLPVLNRSDSDHATVYQIWQRLLHRQTPLVSSSYVLLETFALAQNRLGVAAVTVFHKDVVPILDVVWVSSQLHELGVAALLAANRRRLSLVDCVSFEICQQQQIREVFAFDNHFVEHDFTLLS